MNATAQERARLGKARRELVTRAALAKLYAKDRRFDPVDVLRADIDGWLVTRGRCGVLGSRAGLEQARKPAWATLPGTKT